jgi:hypothetical protein
MARTRPHSRRGATAVEFAMTFPVMALILMITVEFGFYYSQLAMVQSVAIESVRFGANQPNSSIGETAAEQVALILLEDSGFDCDALDCEIRAIGSNAGVIPTVEIEIEVEYAQVTGILPGGRLGYAIRVPRVLPARATMPIAGP